MKHASVSSIVRKLEFLHNPRNVEGMARYGIVARKAFGVPTPVIRAMAKDIGRNHELALKLWQTEILEARAIAALIDDPHLVTEGQMERWVKDFDSWAVCDGCCSNLFDKTDFALAKARVWSRRSEEFVKRAGFVLMAALAVHAKDLPDSVFISFLPTIVRESEDERNFVRKAVNWALRQIGKRNIVLHRKAVTTARQIGRLPSSTARWIAADALRELTGTAVLKRLRSRHKSSSLQKRNRL